MVEEPSHGAHQSSLSPDVAHRFVRLGRDWQQDGFGSVLKERRPVLGLAFLDPVAVDLEGARVDELADGFDGVRVALDHLLGDGFGAAVVAVDAHCGEDGHADDLREESQWVHGLLKPRRSAVKEN